MSTPLHACRVVRCSRLCNRRGGQGVQQGAGRQSHSGGSITRLNDSLRAATATRRHTSFSTQTSSKSLQRGVASSFKILLTKVDLDRWGISMDESHLVILKRNLPTDSDGDAYCPATSHEQALACVRGAADEAWLLQVVRVGQTLLGQCSRSPGCERSSAFLTTHFSLASRGFASVAL